MEVDQRIVLPGDVIDVDTESTIVLGPGLRQEGDDVVATKAGILRHLEVGNRWWIESNQKRVIQCNTSLDNSNYINSLISILLQQVKQ